MLMKIKEKNTREKGGENRTRGGPDGQKEERKLKKKKENIKK